MAATGALQRGQHHNRMRSPESVTSRRRRCSGSTSRQRARIARSSPSKITASQRWQQLRARGFSRGPASRMDRTPPSPSGPTASRTVPRGLERLRAGRWRVRNQPPPSRHERPSRGQTLRRSKNSEDPSRSRREPKNQAGQPGSGRLSRSHAGRRRSHPAWKSCADRNRPGLNNPAGRLKSRREFKNSAGQFRSRREQTR